MSTRTRTLCVVPDCFVSGRHTKDCLEQPGIVRCDGCMPGLALDGLLICKHHRDKGGKQLRRLPGLYVDLTGELVPYRSPQALKPVGGRTNTPRKDGEGPLVLRETAAVVNEDVSRMQQQILSGLFNRCAYIVGELGLTMPREDASSMVAFLDRQVDWLSSHPATAAVWGEGFTQLAVEAARLRRNPPAGLLLGRCPLTKSQDGEQAVCNGRVSYDRQEARSAERERRPYLIECPRCQHADTLAWWAKQIIGDYQPPTLLPAARLAMILGDRLAVELAAAGKPPITANTIGKWKFNGLIAPAACALKPPHRDLFLLADAEAFARDYYGLTPLEQVAS